jgi:hypothetical protein
MIRQFGIDQPVPAHGENHTAAHKFYVLEIFAPGFGIGRQNFRLS